MRARLPLACSTNIAILLASVFAILYEVAAERDLRRFRAHEVRQIMAEVDVHLTEHPVTPSRRRKLLEGLLPPWDAGRPVWQLRVGDFRVFYDVDEARQEVIVRAIRRKGSQTTQEIL